MNHSNRDYTLAFDRYEKLMRNFVEDAQNLAESKHQLFADADSTSVTLQL